MKLWKNVPHSIQLVIIMTVSFGLYGAILFVLDTYSNGEILAVMSFAFLIISMMQHDIIKLRLYGACAGICFVLQFALSDLPIINVLGQGALVIYGIYQAVKEFKIKKKKALLSEASKAL